MPLRHRGLWLRFLWPTTNRPGACSRRRGTSPSTPGDRSPTLLPSSGTSEAEVHTTSIVPQSATEFVDSLRLPLEVTLIKALPHARVARNADDCWAPRRSDRLAAKSAFRDPSVSW